MKERKKKTTNRQTDRLTFFIFIRCLYRGDPGTVLLASAVVFVYCKGRSITERRVHHRPLVVQVIDVNGDLTTIDTKAVLVPASYNNNDNNNDTLLLLRRICLVLASVQKRNMEVKK